MQSLDRLGQMHTIGEEHLFVPVSLTPPQVLIFLLSPRYIFASLKMTVIINLK